MNQTTQPQATRVAIIRAGVAYALLLSGLATGLGKVKLVGIKQMPCTEIVGRQKPIAPELFSLARILNQ